MTIYSLILVITILLVTNNNNPVVLSQNVVDPKIIIGGSSVPSSRYPYYAEVRVREEGSSSFFTCGGALVHQDVVLTAAQCYRTNALITVIIQGEEVNNVVDTRQHDDWKQNFPFDIMVLKLERSFLQFDPVPYYSLSNDIIIEEGTKVYAIGSATTNDVSSSKKSLNELELSVSSFEQCNKNYAYLLNEDKHICTTNSATSDADNNNSCMLDGGGPLILKSDNNTDILIGIASFGKECNSNAAILNGFTFVSGYEEWILETICAVSESRWSHCPMPSASPSESHFPSHLPTGMPSISLEPTSPSASPSTVPTITRLDCSDYPCGDNKWNVCTVNEATKMTEQACSRKGEKYFGGWGDHYCGQCRNTCFELDEELQDHDDKCDDVKYCKFRLIDDDSMQRCSWLQGQSKAIRDMYCGQGETRLLCRETCGLCSDTCEDDDTANVFVNGIKRDCDYLRNRPMLKDIACYDGSDAWIKCKEYCGNCKNTLGEERSQQQPVW